MSKFLLLDSRKRSYGSANQFRIYLDNTITITDYICLNYIVIPRCNYLINNSNNTFTVNFQSNHAYTITVANQTYTPLQLCSYINQIFGNLNGFNITYNTQTYCLTFNSTVPFTIDFSTSNFYRLLSLEKKVYNSDINNSIQSNVINFNYPYYINLNINNLSQNCIQSSDNNSNVNFIIPVLEVNFSDIINYKNSKIKISVGKQTLNYFDIIITDDYNDLYQNNNFEWYGMLSYE